MDKDQDIQNFVKEHAISLYTELNGDDKLILGENLNEVINTEPIELLKRVLKLFVKMNESKKIIFRSDQSEKFIEIEGYQKEMQKLDSEIRGHFKNELEMKIVIDSMEEKMEAFQTEKISKVRTDFRRIEELAQENKSLREKIKGKNAEIDMMKKINEGEELLGLESKVKKESEIIQELEKLNEKKFKKFTKSKGELELIKHDCEQLKLEYLELKSIIDCKKEVKGLIQNSINKEALKDFSELKTSRVFRIVDKIEKSSSPLPLSKKKPKLPSKINKSSSRIEKSPISFHQIPNSFKKKGKKLIKLSKTPKKSYTKL